LIIIIIKKKTSCLSSLKCYSSSEKKNRDLFSFYRLLVPRRNVCRNQMGLTIGNEEWEPIASIPLIKISCSMAFLLFYRLMECAKAIEGGNLDVADSLLAEIRSLAPKEESIYIDEESCQILCWGSCPACVSVEFVLHIWILYPCYLHAIHPITYIILSTGLLKSLDISLLMPSVREIKDSTLLTSPSCSILGGVFIN